MNRSPYGSKQASTAWHGHLVVILKGLDFDHNLADACVFRFVEAGHVAVIAVVHVDDMFAVVLEERFDRFCDDFSHLLPINSLGEL